MMVKTQTISPAYRRSLCNELQKKTCCPLGLAGFKESWGWFAGGAPGSFQPPWKGFAPVSEAPLAPSLEQKSRKSVAAVWQH